MCKVPLPPHTPRTSEPDCLGLILWPVTPPPLPVYSVCIYSRGSGGGSQPLPCVAGGLGCVLGWPMNSLSYGRHSLFAFPPPLVGTELGR
jgi:hypothetical protein